MYVSLFRRDYNRFPSLSIIFFSNRSLRISLFLSTIVRSFSEWTILSFRYFISFSISSMYLLIFFSLSVLSLSSASLLNLFAMFKWRLLLPLDAERQGWIKLNLLETIRESLKILLILGSTWIVRFLLFKISYFLQVNLFLMKLLNLEFSSVFPKACYLQVITKTKLSSLYWSAFLYIYQGDSPRHYILRSETW